MYGSCLLSFSSTVGKAKGELLFRTLPVLLFPMKMKGRDPFRVWQPLIKVSLA